VARLQVCHGWVRGQHNEKSHDGFHDREFER
jgi:hypothetical protein